MNLYQIDEAIMSLIDEETGEITGFEALEKLQLERDTKIENVALWVKNLKAEVEAIKTEKQSLTERQQKAEKKIDSLTRYLKDALNGQKFETARCLCSFRKSEKVEVKDIWQIPEVFLKYAEPTADKTKLKEALKNGEEIEGCQLVQSFSLTVK